MVSVPGELLLSYSIIMELWQSLPSCVPALLLVGTTWAFHLLSRWPGQRSCVGAALNLSSKGSNGPKLASDRALRCPLAQTLGERSKLPFLCLPARADLFWRCQQGSCASLHGNSSELTSVLLGSPQVCHKPAQTLGGSSNLPLD